MRENQVYKQRFTPLGGIGSLGAIFGPLAMAYGVQEYTQIAMEYAANPYIKWAPPMNLFIIFGYLASTVGFIMVIVGREQYLAENKEIPRPATKT